VVLCARVAERLGQFAFALATNTVMDSCLGPHDSGSDNTFSPNVAAQLKSN